MAISDTAKAIMLDVERRSLDPLQRLILQASRSSREQAAIQECFMGRAMEKMREHMGNCILFTLVDILRSIRLAGVERTLEIYYSYRAVTRLVLPGEITKGFQEVQHMAESMPDDDLQALELLSPIASHMEHLTWNNLMGLGKLAQEYNVEWALASYDWESGVGR